MEAKKTTRHHQKREKSINMPRLPLESGKQKNEWWNLISSLYIQDVTKQLATQRSSSSESKDQKDDGKSGDESEGEPEAPTDREFDEEQTRADIIKTMEESLMPSGETIPNLLWIPDGLTNAPGTINDR